MAPTKTPSPTVKFTIDGKALYDALRSCAPVMSYRSCIPILTCVRITGAADGLTVEANDLDFTIRHHIPGDFPAFAVAVEYWRLYEFMRLMKWSAFTIEAGPDTFRLLDFLFAAPEGAHFETMPVQDFPDFEVPADLYAKPIPFDPSAIRLVRAAISTEETRYYLNGVYFESDEDDTLRLVATDGHRLRILRMDTTYFGPGVIVPRRVAYWLSACKPGDLFLHESRVGFIQGPVTALAKVIDGKFPDYRRVTPHILKGELTVNRTELIRLTAMARIFSPGRHVAHLRYELADGKLKVIGKGDKSAATLELPADHTPGETLSIGFNARYLTEALADLKGETVTLQYQDNASPLLLTEDKLTQVLMPTRY